MKYLITGGAGFIGSHLSEALIARGDSVIVFYDLSTGKTLLFQLLSLFKAQFSMKI